MDSASNFDLTITIYLFITISCANFFRTHNVRHTKVYKTIGWAIPAQYAMAINNNFSCENEPTNNMFFGKIPAVTCSAMTQLRSTYKKFMRNTLFIVRKTLSRTVAHSDAVAVCSCNIQCHTLQSFKHNREHL